MLKMNHSDNSSLSARQPDQLILLAIERDSVERGEIAYAMTHMWQMVSTAAALREHAHCLSIAFLGYDDDPRELYEVPQVRAYVRKLMTHCPWFALLLNKWDGAIFQLLPALVSEANIVSRVGLRVSVETDNRETLQLAMRCIKGAGVHLQQLGFPQDEADQLVSGLVTAITRAW